jgi:hypothetical protein
VPGRLARDAIELVEGDVLVGDVHDGRVQVEECACSQIEKSWLTLESAVDSVFTLQALEESGCWYTADFNPIEELLELDRKRPRRVDAFTLDGSLSAVLITRCEHVDCPWWSQRTMYSSPGVGSSRQYASEMVS